VRVADETPKEGAAPGPAPPKPASPPAAAAAKKGPVATDASQKPLVAALAAAVPGAVLSAKEFVSETTVDIALDKIVDACRHLKNESFAYLVDLTAVDWKERQPRFDVVYYLHSFLRNNERIRLKVKVKEGEACPSATAVFETSNWMEREVFDLFGIPFANHPDLRRILTWEGFNGHPLRKDFPVEGIDTGAAIYPDRYPEGGGPASDDPNRKTLS
jgi:NADH-quinone oxidoreductase subunit C